MLCLGLEVMPSTELWEDQAEGGDLGLELGSEAKAADVDV